MSHLEHLYFHISVSEEDEYIRRQGRMIFIYKET